MADENSETKTVETPVIPSPSVESPASEQVATEFNPSTYETSLGLPTGSLKDCKTEEEALDVIQKAADQALQAGLGRVPAAPVEKPTEPAGKKKVEFFAKDPAQKVADAIVTDAKGGNSPEYDELRKKVDELSEQIQARDKAAEASLAAQVEARTVAAIDSWSTPKFGVTGHRTYQQEKAVRTFKAELLDLVQGYAEKGKPIPLIEQAAMRLWAYTDGEGFKKHITGAKKTEEVPLGTPGHQKAPAGGTVDPKAPGNIHEAVYQGGRFTSLRK